LNLSAIYSKTGKGVQESSGKTSHLSRADRAVLSAIDGKTVLSEVQNKFEKLAGPKFEALIQQLDKDGFIREVSSGASQPAAPSRPAAPPPRAAPPPKAPAADTGEDSGLDFTAIIKVPPKAPAPTPPKAPPMDLAAAARAEAERKAKEQDAFNYKARAEAEAKAKAEAEAKARAAAIEARARVEAEVKAKAAAEAKARAEAEAKGRADAEARTRAEAEAKVKAAREAAVRMATEANAKAGAADRERQAAEERARKESEDKARLESELNAKLAEERKAREAAETARKELEEKARRDAEELRQRLEAEMKAKLEEERKAREAEDRKRREEEDRKRREEDDRRRKEEEARRAKEEAERKAREEEDRKRREEEDRKRREEDDRRRKEEEARRAKEEAERRARKEEEERRAKEEADRRKQDEDRRAKEAAERRAREEQDSKRRKEEEALRAKEDADRRQREDDERRKRDEAERKAKDEAEARARAAQSASLPAIEPVSMPAPAAPVPAAPPPSAAGAGDIGDSLLADLESFSRREEEETRAKEEAERKAKEEAARRAKEEAERIAKEETEKKRREEEARRRKEEEEKHAREEAERQAREEEDRLKEEEAERKRKAKEALAAKKAEEKSARAATDKSTVKGDDDIGVTDDDLDMDDVKSDHKALSKSPRKAEQEQARPAAAVAVRRPVKWGKPAAIALFVLLVGGVGVLNVMPVSTAEYEKAASEAMGVPVKIGSARLSVLTGVEVQFESVSIGDGVKIRLVRASPEMGSLFGSKKAFSRIELEGASISQAQLADAVLGKVSGENFRVARIVIKQAKFDGPLALPPLDVEAAVSGDGMLQSVTARGGDKLSVQLSPKGNDIGFEISAGSLALPIVPALTLSEFGMKGTANRGGVVSSEFDGRVYDGVLTGSAKIRWGATWYVDGEVRARAIKVAVFAPALVSEGKLEGKGNYAMSGSVPASLFESAKVQGDFKIEKGVLGSFNLTRALQTGGAQSSGRTEFSELTGQAVYDKGAIQVRNVSITAGAMNAGASLDIDPNGGLSGRIAADVKTPNQTLRATLTLSGKVQDPVIRK
jgi:hypothetical protein